LGLGQGKKKMAEKGHEVILRDDQSEFASLFDAARIAQKKGQRLNLIDTGQLDSAELEWLGEVGANLYTSDEAKRSAQELMFISKVYNRVGGIVAYFHHGPIETEEKPGVISFSNLRVMGRSGIYLHLSNRERQRDFLVLNELAYDCWKGEAWLVYYHLGPLDKGLEDLAGSGAWIHLSDLSLKQEKDVSLLLEVIKAAREANAHLILHLEKGLPLSWVRDILSAGAIVLFKTALSDYKSPFRALELKAKKRKLDFRTYYLYSTFLP
jgi:hypothetical protein